MTRAAWAKAVFGLLARPASLFFGIAWLGTTLLAAEQSRRTGSWLLVATLTPLPMGLIVGQLVQELQHTTMAWTLPQVRPAIGFSLVTLGVLWGIVLTSINHAFHPANSALVLMSYGAFALLGFAGGVSLLDRLYGWSGFVPLALVGLFAFSAQAKFGGNVLVTVAASAVAVAAAAWCVHRTISLDALRRRPSVPMLAFTDSHLRGAVERYRRDRLAASPAATTGLWDRRLVDARVSAWVSAAFYERRGFRHFVIAYRGGGVSDAIGGYATVFQNALGGVAVLLFLCGAVSHTPWPKVWLDVHRTLMAPASGLSYFALAMALTMTVTSSVGSTPFPLAGLQPYLNHPLSRVERARVAFVTDTLFIALVGLVVGSVFALVAWMAGLAAHDAGPVARIPGLVPPLALTLSALPSLIRRSRRAELPAAQRESPALWTIVGCLLVGAIGGSAVFANVLAASVLVGLHPALQWLPWIGLLASSLGIHWLRIRRLHRRGDLI